MNTSKIIHREENRIKVDFPYNQQIAIAIKQINDTRWSQTHRAWHIPDTDEAWSKLKSLFPEIVFNEISSIDKPVDLGNSIIQSVNNQPVSNFVSYQNKSKIYVEVIGRKILVKMPKNDADVKFLLTLRFSKWEKD